jgi:hypothetical protein
MKQVTTYVGIDAHKKDLFVAMLVGHEKTPVTWQLAGPSSLSLHDVPHRERRIARRPAPDFLEQAYRKGLRHGRVAAQRSPRGTMARAARTARWTDWQSQGATWRPPSPPSRSEGYRRELVRPQQHRWVDRRGAVSRPCSCRMHPILTLALHWGTLPDDIVGKVQPDPGVITCSRVRRIVLGNDEKTG